jgi:flagellar biosynthesis protein FlhF
MELKRIIAKDTRTANEKAMALYGSDVLIISSCQVRGQTELIVAVDIEPIAPEIAVKEEFIPSKVTYTTKKKSSVAGDKFEDKEEFVPAHLKLQAHSGSSGEKSFEEVLEQTLKNNKRIERTQRPYAATRSNPLPSPSASDQMDTPRETTLSAKQKSARFVGPVRPLNWAELRLAQQQKQQEQEQEQELSQNQTNASQRAQKLSVQALQEREQRKEREEREVLRGKEIVDLVREELATLRKEFKLSQQLAMWQGTPLSRNLQPLRNALNEAPIPAALRALLIDSIQSFDDVEPALQEIKRQLCSTIESSHVAGQVQVPDSGVHVLAGPSGSGKSLMVARLAQEISASVGSEQVAVISYCDLRAGAWNQAQLLSAQSGVDCFRANTPATLKLLIEEHSNKKVVFIDTPGVQMSERIAEIQSVSPQAQFHAVLPADVSLTTLRRIFGAQQMTWHSLMITKLDESSQPWPLIQCLTEGHVNVSVASRGERLGDWIRQVRSEDLVIVALSNLSLSHNDIGKEEGLPSMDMTRIARLASQLTGSKHE